MAWEIERRYLVAVSDALWLSLGEGRQLRQGYVREREPAVRVRTGESRGSMLTCKTGSGIRRTEVEAVIPDEMALLLFQAAEDRVVEKMRWEIGAWTFDRFLGPLDGLHLLEIELETEGQAIPNAPRGIHILREVTEDKRFVSSVLAGMSSRAQKRLVKKVYKEVKGWKGLSG